MVEVVLCIVATASKDTEVVIMWIWSCALIISHHVCPDLIDIHAVCIVEHIWGEAAARTHVDLKRYEVADVAKATVSGVEAEELEVHEARTYVERLDALTTPVTEVLVHVLLNVVGRVEVEVDDVGDRWRTDAPALEDRVAVRVDDSVVVTDIASDILLDDVVVGLRSLLIEAPEIAFVDNLASTVGTYADVWLGKERITSILCEALDVIKAF